MRVSTVTGPGDARSNGRLARWAVCLGFASAILVILGIGWLPFGFPVGIVLAVVALGLGVASLRREGIRAAAIVGMAIGSLALLGVLFLVLLIAFAPGD